MTFEIREVGIERAAEIAKLFSDHFDYQTQMDGHSSRDPAFDPEAFVRSMMNPKLNVFLAALEDDRIVGFFRFGITHGGGLVPLDERVDRIEKGYLGRLPRTILVRLRNAIEALIDRIDRRSTPFNMLAPALVGYMCDLYVVPERRGSGVGKALLEKVEEWYRANAVYDLELNYLANNEKGRAFWKARGYIDRRVLARKKLPR